MKVNWLALIDTNTRIKYETLDTTDLNILGSVRSGKPYKKYIFF